MKMKRLAVTTLTVVVLLLGTNRSPAPIVEESTPAPTATPQNKAKPQPSSATSESAKHSARSTQHTVPSASPSGQRPKFAGTWRGLLPFGPFGDLNLTLVINKEGTLITETGGVVDGSHRAAHAGDVVTWRSGALDSINWTLTPRADGKTASVAVKGGLLIGDHTAVFHRVSP